MCTARSLTEFLTFTTGCRVRVAAVPARLFAVRRRHQSGQFNAGFPTVMVRDE